MFSIEPADAATQGETGNTGHRDGSQRRRQPKRLGGAIELAQNDSRQRHGDASLRIDMDTLQMGKIEHETAFADGAPGDIVSPALHREQEVVLAGEVDGAPD